MQRVTTIAVLLALAGTPLHAQPTKPADGTPAQPETRPAATPEAKPAPVQSPDAIAALQATSEAVKDGFSAQVSAYAEGSLAASFSRSEGLWVQNALGEPGQWKVRYTGGGTVALKNDTLDFDALWSHDRVAWLDHANKTYSVEPLKGGRGGETFQLFNGAFAQLEPLSRGFADELANADLEMREPAEIEGIPCNVVAITSRKGSDPVLWFLSREDHLPRRCEIVLPGQDLIKSLRVDLTQVNAGAAGLSEASWELKAPADYAQKISRQFQERIERPAGPTGRVPAPNAGAAPDWEVADSEGALISPGALRGKVSVLYFWGTWSPACKKALPVLQAFAEDYKDKPVELVSLAFREGSPDAVVRAAREEGQTWRQVPAADEVVKTLGIRVAPSFVVLGPQGELLLRSGRPKGEDYEALFSEIREITDRTLAQPEPAADGKKSAEGPGSKGPGEHIAPAAVTPAGRGGMPTRRKGG
ncbi:MAG: TlpA family protein disulfide reductase [Phycisphaerales bacterium]|nr:TlpA family protein disulfide reductase [Phycisphaerales bacterium]